MDGLKTICLILGPNRNLTTLTASCCMLHHEVQVLNHYFSINTNPETIFLSQYAPDKVDNFVTHVLDINKTGFDKPGDGGVITVSHAFAYKRLKKLFFKLSFVIRQSGDPYSILT